MTRAEIVRRLRRLVRRWQKERGAEVDFQNGVLTGQKPGAVAYEKSEGIWVAYGTCVRDLEELLTQIEKCPNQS